MLEARSGSVPEELKTISKQEDISPEKLRTRLADGRIIVVRNLRRVDNIRIFGIGEGLSTKVNVNIGKARQYAIWRWKKKRHVSPSNTAQTH